MAADNDSNSEPSSPVVELLERVGLAALGAVALTAERADALADELAKSGGMRRDEALRMSERAGAGMEGLFHQLGLVSRSDFEELELRVAQLEHRLRLVEGNPTGSAPPASH